MQRIIIVGISLSLILSTIGLGIYILFQADLRTSHQRVTNGSQIINTVCGPMEYAETGNGQPVLLIHGAGGGFDQGLLMGEMLLGDNYRVIAPSRFGYLNAGFPADTSLESQAAHYICLLDALNITEPVIVMPVSAGGPSGLHFTRNFPDRTQALITISAISFIVPELEDRAKEQFINRIVGSDFVYWGVTKVFPNMLLEVLGVTKQLQSTFTQKEWDQAKVLLEVMLPASDRFAGVLLDQTRSVPAELVEMVDVPALVIHAEDDTLVDISNAEHSAAGIKGAVLVKYQTGGHLQLGNIADIQVQVENFLKQLD